MGKALPERGEDSRECYVILQMLAKQWSLEARSATAFFTKVPYRSTKVLDPSPLFSGSRAVI